MKNTKRILWFIVVFCILVLIVFGIVLFNKHNQENVPLSTQGKQMIEILESDKEWNDSFKRDLINKYKNEYISNYNKIKLEKEIEDIGRVLQFEQLSPIIKVPPINLFESIPYFQENSIDHYDFYTFTVAFFSTGFYGDIDLKVIGPQKAVAFWGNEYLFIPQGEQPTRYFSAFMAIKKGENISDYKIAVNSKEPTLDNKIIDKVVEITPVYLNLKTSGELKIGDSFVYELNDNLTLYGTVMDIMYEKTMFGTSSPDNSSFIYMGSLGRTRILYAIEGSQSDNLFFEKNNVLSILNPYITSDYEVSESGIDGLNYKSDVVIMPYYDNDYLGSFTTNGILGLSTEAYVRKELWDVGPDSVGFDKDVKIHFGDFYINLKAKQ